MSIHTIKTSDVVEAIEEADAESSSGYTQQNEMNYEDRPSSGCTAFEALRARNWADFSNSQMACYCKWNNLCTAASCVPDNLEKWQL